MSDCDDRIRHFIKQAADYDIPTQFLTRLINESDFKCKSGTGLDHYSPFWHEITLYQNTWKGVDRPGLPDSASVQTLYHEATHAYIDLDDYDQTREFGEAMKYYDYVKLQDGNRVYDTERAVQEAAAAYVGHRASVVWMAWWRLDFLAGLLRNVLAGKVPVARGTELVLDSRQHSIPTAYNLYMQRRVFGYTEDGGDQSEIASTPIFDKLRAYCDRAILENKIADDFNHMLRLRINFETLYKSMGQVPPMAEAMIHGSTAP